MNLKGVRNKQVLAMTLSDMACKVLFLLVVYVGIIKHNYFRIKIKVREHKSTVVGCTTANSVRKQA